ncbi:uncharacterized protein LOC122936194 [Bufo gargarizans]|uniref:uncharacterized protein LOC122936194 n=1 Tax=Bufo gargarizans TaxID=30331 RepID=UPI001CF0FCD5|nr:uncharacterized protein LOC122936194 [Bufo gargarizans]
MMKSKEITRFQLKTETQDWCKMAQRVVAVIYIVLILGKEFQAEPIAVPGPSSGIMLQDTTGFILTNKRILSQKIYVSLDPRVFVERQFNISEISSPEIKIWYQMHIGYSQERVTQILEQTRKTMTREQFSTSRRPKRFISAITAAIIFAVVGTVIATGVSAVNSISVKTLELEIGSLKRNLMSIHAEMENQKKHLSDLYSVVEDTVVTTNLHSKLLTHSINLQKSNEQFKQELISLKERIDFHTQVYHDEVQSGMQDLREGRIPLYFVSYDIIRKMLQQVSEEKVEDFQLNLAFNMGIAIPLYMDPIKMEICFLLSIPVVSTNNVFQMKRVHNVGTWKDNIHVRIQTPDIVAYQPWKPDWLSVPILDNCVTFRDNNFQCEGDPFNYDATNTLCGLEYETHGSEKCQVTLSKIEEDKVVNAVLIQDKWLVSTRLPDMTVFSNDHVMVKVIALPSRVSIVKVPRNSRIMIGNRTLYPVDIGDVEGEVESIDAFQNQEITINPDLKFLLDNKPSHTVRMVIRKDNVTMDTLQYSVSDTDMLHPSVWSWGADYVWGVLIVIILGWLSFLTIQVVRWLRFFRKTLAKLWLEHYKPNLRTRVLEEPE